MIDIAIWTDAESSSVNQCAFFCRKVIIIEHRKKPQMGNPWRIVGLSGAQSLVGV